MNYIFNSLSRCFAFTLQVCNVSSDRALCVNSITTLPDLFTCSALGNLFRITTLYRLVCQDLNWRMTQQAWLIKINTILLLNACTFPAEATISDPEGNEGCVIYTEFPARELNPGQWRQKRRGTTQPPAPGKIEVYHVACPV